MKKFKLILTETIEFDGKTLYRIEALRSFFNVNGIEIKKGDKGGFVENETNLSQLNSAWIYDNAKVYDTANVSGNARVYGNARVHGNSRIWDEALVDEEAEICDNTFVHGVAIVRGNAKFQGRASIWGNALVQGNAIIDGDACIRYAAAIYGDALVTGYAKVGDYAKVWGNAIINGDLEIGGNARIHADAVIHDYSDLLVVGPIGSRNDYTTFFRNASNRIAVSCGCFFGTIDDFAIAVRCKHGNDEHGVVYNCAIELAKARMIK